jgi:hypothetical protein
VHGLKIGAVHRCRFSARVEALLNENEELRQTFVSMRHVAVRFGFQSSPKLTTSTPSGLLG